jgi:outer membrane murein-binding lipoprotein Lpp
MKKCEHDLIEDECFSCLRATVSELAVEAVKLNARISYLRAKNDELESDIRSMGDRKDDAEARAVGLAVKMARYRDALEAILANEEAYKRGDALSAYIAKTALGIPV